MKNKQPVTIRGGVNVAPVVPPPKSTKKTETTEPEPEKTPAVETPPAETE